MNNRRKVPRTGPPKPKPVGTEYECLRCGHNWLSKKPGIPIACAGCKSAYWNKPQQIIPHAASGAGSGSVK